ncbi:MAG: hypothetical protein AVDCRST_MAG87-1758, partial [uncultured Thermomicrobiales bacterium]
MTRFLLNRSGRTFGALIAGVILLGSPAVAQESSPPASPPGNTIDIALRAAMASITLDESALPDGYAFEGETFLTAEQSASGTIEATAL